MVRSERKMSGIPDDIFSSYTKATSSLFQSSDVARVLNSLDNLLLIHGDLRGEEPELKLALELEKDEILRELQMTEKLTSEIKKLDSENQNLAKEIRATEVNAEEKRLEKIPCKEDEETLRNIRKTLRLYKDITNIRWDYSAPENEIKGYLYGTSKNYVHRFEIPSNDPEAVDKMWQEIKNASSEASNDLKGKENVCDNKNT